MLKLSDLKTWLHRDLANTDKLLLILSSDERPWQVAEIRDRAKDAGLNVITKWNVSQILGRTKGLAINTPSGWELSESGKQHLRTLGVGNVSPAAAQVATDLREVLSKVRDKDTRAFVEEAVQCFEFEFYRSATVMSWLAAVHVLKREVHQNHLDAFNSEASRVDSRWKPARTTDDLGQMKEAEFLDRLAAISVIGRNVKEELHSCLKTRNACGHPNSFKLSTNRVASHIESLLLNVFQPFAK